MARARKESNGYRPRLKERYEQELRPQLKDQLGVSSLMDVPRLQKITLNMGIGDAKTEAKVLENALEQLTTIAGQRAQVRRARKSIASFKLREGMPVGVRVTLRGARMWEFLDRLISIALPRIRDFRGLSRRSCAVSACPSRAWRKPEPARMEKEKEKEKRPSGQEISDRQGVAPAEVQGAKLHPLQALRPPARRLPQVRPLPDLPA